MPRSPPSPAWIVWKYAHACGSLERHADLVAALGRRISFHQSILQKVSADLIRAKVHLSKLETLRDRYAAVLSLHDIPLEASRIAAVRPQEVPRTIAYGGMTRVIYAAIRSGVTEGVATSAIVAAVKERMSSKAHLTPVQLRQRVLVRLCILAKQGRINGSKRRNGCDRLWTLPAEEPSDGTASRGRYPWLEGSSEEE